MPQARFIEGRIIENGIELEFEDLNGNRFFEMYNGKLTIDQLEKLKGTQISYSGKEEGIELQRAWEGKKPVFSKEPYEGDDRADM